MVAHPCYFLRFQFEWKLKIIYFQISYTEFLSYVFLPVLVLFWLLMFILIYTIVK